MLITVCQIVLQIKLFEIVYVHPPCHLIDLVELPLFEKNSRATEHMETRAIDFEEFVHSNLEAAYAKYKVDADEHKRKKIFKKEIGVLAYIKKNRFYGVHSKL